MATFEELIGDEMKKAMKEVIADLHLIKNELSPQAVLADTYNGSTIPDEYRYVSYVGSQSSMSVSYSGFNFTINQSQTVKLPFKGGILNYSGSDLWLSTERIFL